MVEVYILNILFKLNDILEHQEVHEHLNVAFSMGLTRERVYEQQGQSWSC